MRYADFAANDPIFYNHHCFVDLTWELWRQKQQKDPKQRPLQYPPDFEKVKNIDGCKNEYTDILYQYAPRPTCSRTNRNCGSK
uniref:Tyrosinase_Cu-bd domain-containing protein n=1 Tax=Meloidogyne hapla TaxID=6305 RepID=A0A1I8BTJ1_MELHA